MGGGWLGLGGRDREGAGVVGRGSNGGEVVVVSNLVILTFRSAMTVCWDAGDLCKESKDLWMLSKLSECCWTVVQTVSSLVKMASWRDSCSVMLVSCSSNARLRVIMPSVMESMKAPMIQVGRKDSSGGRRGHGGREKKKREKFGKIFVVALQSIFSTYIVVTTSDNENNLTGIKTNICCARAPQHMEQGILVIHAL